MRGVVTRDDLGLDGQGHRSIGGRCELDPRVAGDVGAVLERVANLGHWWPAVRNLGAGISS